MLRTSDTHPLQIAGVDAGADRGKIGVTFAPGKNDRFATGGPWARDLDKDLDAIVAWDARTIVTLLESHELAHLAITRLGVDLHFMLRLETSLPTVSISCETGIALSFDLDVMLVPENHRVPLPLQQALNSTPVVDRPVYESQLKCIKSSVQSQMNCLRRHYSLT